jgi:hypothetical protein
MENRMLRRSWFAALLIIGIFAAAGYGQASSPAPLSQGATVYVPVYSHIYVGIKGHTFDLAISLSVRNPNLKDTITLTSVAYHDSDGKFVRSYLDNPIQVAPLASKDFFVGESDSTGGLGASFVVKWKSQKPVNEPVIEGVMAGTRSGQGISFTTRGQVIRDLRE